MPQPVQTENLSPIKYEPAEPVVQQADKKKVTNNINITVKTEESKNTLCCRISHTCMGIIIGIAVVVVILIAFGIAMAVIKYKANSLITIKTTTKRASVQRASFNCPSGFTGKACNIG